MRPKKRERASAKSASKSDSAARRKSVKSNKASTPAKKSTGKTSPAPRKGHAKKAVVAPVQKAPRRVPTQGKSINAERRYSFRQTRQRQERTAAYKIDSLPEDERPGEAKDLTQQNEPLRDFPILLHSIEYPYELGEEHYSLDLLGEHHAIEEYESLPYCNEEQLSLIRAVLDNPRLGERIMACAAGIRSQLEMHRNVNVDMEGSPDPLLQEVEKMVSSLPLDCVDEASSETLTSWWKSDKRKCKDSNEAVFQRTLMIEMIDRHRLFFHKELDTSKFCDFSVEQEWAGSPMPTRGISQAAPVDVSKMKPDLCISFLTKSVLDRNDTQEFPDTLRDLIFFEGSSRTQRAFPFLMVEAKTSYLSPDNEQAFLQSLNYASQALHILFEFLREADPEDQDSDMQSDETFFKNRFFDWVRVFSAVATSKGVIIRIHRATEIKSGQRGRITKSYPLRFEHVTFKEFDEKSFKREDVVRVFENIIWAYGKELMDLLHQAGSQIAKKFIASPALLKKRTSTYYRHGLAPRQRKTQSQSQSRRNSTPVQVSQPAQIVQPSTPVDNRDLQPLSNGTTSAQSSFSFGKRLNLSEGSPAKRRG